MSGILEVKNLSVSYDGTPVVSNISFSLDEGRSLALLGPNGAGKSTIFKAILGLIAYKGEINWIKKPSIGFVPQRFDFDKNIPMTVMEFMLLHADVKFGFWFPKKEILEDIEKSLNYVNAKKHLNRKIGDLSSGEFQRVLIARALFGKPNVMLFDEPTADIDVEGEMTIYPLLKKLSKELSFTLVLISHDLNVVYDFADEVICLNKKMMCVGAPKVVLTPDQLNQLYGEGVGFYVHHNHKL
ncbi:metal ABC transporter ATP-binding protein [Candidatus Azambacteria bacterium]|nr:metal ABC transporter ATP-binding protein [Candidatus Azambacteria bacterium]